MLELERWIDNFARWYVLNHGRLYQMPGGDWAVAILGVVSDGFATKGQALDWAVEQVGQTDFGALLGEGDTGA